jgi:hypothetical protein
MLEEFCEGKHCDQYIHSIGGSYPQCLMVQRELSRVGHCPLRYDTIPAKVIPDVKSPSGSVVHTMPAGKKGFSGRPK